MRKETTICVNLAAGLAHAGYRVLVVDADPQASALGWRNNSEESKFPFEVVSLPTPNIHRELPRIVENSSYEIVLIDCPPGGGGSAARDGITQAAILAAGAVIVPVQPTPMDYQAAEVILPLIRNAAAVKPDLQVLIVTSRKQSNNNLMRDSRSAALRFFQIEGINSTAARGRDLQQDCLRGMRRRRRQCAGPFPRLKGRRGDRDADQGGS